MLNCLNILSLLWKVLFIYRLKRSVVFVLALLPALSVQLELVSKRYSFEPSEDIKSYLQGDENFLMFSATISLL